jgi:hypothetical protein
VARYLSKAMGLGCWELVAISILSWSAQKQKTPARAGGRTNVRSPYISSSSTLDEVLIFSVYMAKEKSP